MQMIAAVGEKNIERLTGPRFLGPMWVSRTGYPVNRLTVNIPSANKPETLLPLAFNTVAGSPVCGGGGRHHTLHSRQQCSGYMANQPCALLSIVLIELIKPSRLFLTNALHCFYQNFCWFIYFLCIMGLLMAIGKMQTCRRADLQTING